MRQVGLIKKIGLGVAALFLLSLFFQPGTKNTSDDSAKKTSAKDSEKSKPFLVHQAAEEEKTRASCQESRKEKQKNYQKFMAERRFWDAAVSIRSCANALDDSSLKKLVAEAEIRSHKSDIDNPKLSLRNKAKAIELLMRDYPDEGKKYEALRNKFLMQADAQDRSAEAKRRKSEGVRIGMTKEEVVASSWGRPDYINRTIHRDSEREQWVYGHRNYLYFENGRLSTIQN